MSGQGEFIGLGYGVAAYQPDTVSSTTDAMMQQYSRQCSGVRTDELAIGTTGPQTSNYYVRPMNPVAPSPAPLYQEGFLPLRSRPPSQMIQNKKLRHQPTGIPLPLPGLPFTPPWPGSPHLVVVPPAGDDARPANNPNAATSSATLIPKSEIEAARSRALEVVQRFNQEPKPAELSLADGSGELGLKRKVFYQQFAERLRVAMVKNLEYVAGVEDERLHQKLALQQQAEEYHIQLEDYHNRIFENRSKSMRQQQTQNNNAQAGIGTQQREKQEKKRKQQHIANDSVALYISNLPKDGSATDELMRALFGSYGSLRKIHFYVDRQAGGLKGDALVIYNVDDVADKSDVIDTVCSQVREDGRCLYGENGNSSLLLLETTLANESSRIKDARCCNGSLNAVS
jgi:hypothetical protein